MYPHKFNFKMAGTIVKLSCAASVLLRKRIKRIRGIQTYARFLQHANSRPTPVLHSKQIGLRWYRYSSSATIDDSTSANTTGVHESNRTVVNVNDCTSINSDDTIPGPSDELMQSLPADEQKALQILWMEVEVFRQSGFEAPKALRDNDWLELMKLKSYTQRRKYCRFLMIREFRREKTKERKAIQRLLREEQNRINEESDVGDADGNIQYGLQRNTIFHRIHDTTMNLTYNQWASQAILFGQSLVFDLDYDEYMRTTDCQNCAEQIQMAYGYNKMHRQQFYLHFCNANPSGRTMQCVERSMPNLNTASCLVNVTSKSYLDLFPKERIVYLTPHCTDVLREYDHEDVYVVGGLVDRSVQKPLSLAKAKKEGLRMAKLPLDDYLLWGEAGKALTIDQMLRILLDCKNTGSWEVALRNVPQRKIKKVDEFEMERLTARNYKRKSSTGRSLFNNDEDKSRHVPVAKLFK